MNGCCDLFTNKFIYASKFEVFNLHRFRRRQFIIIHRNW